MPKSVNITKAQLMKIVQKLAKTQTLSQLDKNEIMYEKDVLQLLNISKNTLAKYRKLGYFRFIKLGGTIIYLKSIFLEDLKKQYQ